jgi:hypothetical protein
MGASENIIAAVLILVLFIAGGIAYAGTTVKKKSISDEYFTAFLDERYAEQSLDTALLVTEPVTGRQWADLLASAVYYQRDSINLSGGNVSISGGFEKMLDSMLSSDFYFEVMASHPEVELVFIGPGLDRMIPVYAILERDYDDMLRDLNGTGIGAKGDFIIMEGANICTDIRIGCSYLTEAQVYNNNKSSEFELIKFENSLFRPPSGSDVANDWETALAFQMATQTDKPMSRPIIYFPIVDSLPASSDTNQCNRQYAGTILGRDQSLIREKNVIVNPIIIDSGNATFCLQDVFNHTRALVGSTPGIVTRYNQNFLSDVTKAVRRNLDGMVIRGGSYGTGAQTVIQRDLQMPDGSLAKVRLHVFV